MSARLPAARLPSPGINLRAQDVSAFLSWLRGLEALDYVDVEVEFSGTATGAFDHGLGRAYRGGAVLWISNVAVGLNVLNPESAVDSATQIELGTVGGGAFTGTAMIRVF